jgi:catechol 2,3-dioxygenase-like lactoylglutathione lyase family enzyme
MALMQNSWLVLGSDAVFSVADVARSLEFYGRLGFDTALHSDTYGFASRERGLSIHLEQAAAAGDEGHGCLYLHCQDADRVAAEWRSSGVEVVGPQNEEHGRREGSIADPDGNVIRFGSPIH